MYYIRKNKYIATKKYTLNIFKKYIYIFPFSYTITNQFRIILFHFFESQNIHEISIYNRILLNIQLKSKYNNRPYS